VLILGGTTEARELAERLAPRPELEVTVSLAGRTERIAAHATPMRVGGFGGADGLARHLREADIAALIDATHPYADQISANAARAAADTGVAFAALRRPPWLPVEGDRWTPVADVEAAVHALGAAPRRAFLALGRQEVHAFERAPQHFYLVRSVDPVEPPLAVPRAAYGVERGPFDEAGDRALLLEHRIDAVVSRNSGGSAAYAKLAAARALGVEVIVLARPPLPEVPEVGSVQAAVDWLERALAHGRAHAPSRGAERGV
jgi:precorrin-6A/cobalt-precorrin-6A reductase